MIDESRNVFAENRVLALRNHGIPFAEFNDLCGSVAKGIAERDALAAPTPAVFVRASQYVRAVGRRAADPVAQRKYVRSLYPSTYGPLIDFVDAAGKLQRKGTTYVVR